MFVFEIDWNEFVLAMPVHQFLKMSSHSRTNFAVHRNLACVLRHWRSLARGACDDRVKEAEFTS